MARLYTREMLGVLVRCTRAENATWSEKIRAAEAVLERAHGKTGAAANGLAALGGGDITRLHLNAVLAVAVGTIGEGAAAEPARTGPIIEPDASEELAAAALARWEGLGGLAARRPIAAPDPLDVGLPLFEEAPPATKPDDEGGLP